MNAVKSVTWLAVFLLLCANAYAQGFTVGVHVSDELSKKERLLLEEAGCPLMDGSRAKSHVAVTLENDNVSEAYAAQQAVLALSKGAKGVVFQCHKDLLIGFDFDRKPRLSRLAATFAVLGELLSDIEAGSAHKTTISGVPLFKLKKKDGTFGYAAFSKGKQKVKLKLGKATWRVASLVAASDGKIRRVFRKTDTVSGTLSAAPVMITQVTSTPQPKDGAAKFWDAKGVHTVHLSFSAQAWRALGERGTREPFKKEYVKAHFECDGTRLQGVGVRFKGNSSLMAGSREGKFPFKIDFDRFRDQDYLGMKKLNLSNNFKDPSAMREYLAYEMFAKAGLCAGRAAFAKLYISVEGRFERSYFGLYTAVEQIDGAFLRRKLGNSEGTLFKPEVFGDDPLRYRSDDVRQYERCELKYGEMHPDYDALIGLARLTDKAPAEEFARRVAELLDIDSFLKFLAVNALMANYDSYIGTGHNFYLYYDAPEGRFIFIPWDLNEAFGMFTPRGYNPKTCASVSVLKPVAMGRRALVERILAVGRWRKKYEELLSSLLLGELAERRLIKRVEEIRKVIESASQEKGGRGARQFRSGVEQLKEFIRDRHAAAFYELMMR